MSARPIRVRELLHGIGSWRIVTLNRFGTYAAARDWLNREPATSGGAIFIEHEAAPATLDHMNVAPASR